MIKSILLSNRSKYSYLIMVGEKKYEVRKSKLPQDTWIYNYVTKAKPIIWEFSEFVKHLGHRKFWNGEHYSHDNLSEKAVILNGTIPFRFKVGEIKTFTFDNHELNLYVHDVPEYDIPYDILEKSGLDYWELTDYGKGKTLYFHEIIDLEIFDESKSLSEFHVVKGNIGCHDDPKLFYDDGTVSYLKELKKAPQSYQYIFVRDS